MTLMTCRVSMSCRRSSPDWTETQCVCAHAQFDCNCGHEEEFYLEDDADVVSTRVQVLEGQFERNRIGVKKGARLEQRETD